MLKQNCFEGRNLEHYTKTLPYELELTSRVLHEANRCFFEMNKFPISQEEFMILDCLFIYPNSCYFGAYVWRNQYIDFPS